MTYKGLIFSTFFESFGTDRQTNGRTGNTRNVANENSTW